ncbi:hypothetical protein D3C76_978490 [compost metagenome]
MAIFDVQNAQPGMPRKWSKQFSIGGEIVARQIQDAQLPQLADLLRNSGESGFTQVQRLQIGKACQQTFRQCKARASKVQRLDMRKLCIEFRQAASRLK